MKHHGDPATIKTTHVLPPMPDRRFDYSAHYDDVGEEDSAYGYGRTADEAVADLMGQREEDGP